MTRIATAFRGRLLRFIAGCLAVYAVVAWATPAPALIMVMNDLLLSIATGVCAAYAPVLWAALINPQPTNGEILGVGIYFFGASAILLRLASIIGRDLGFPEIYNSDFITFALCNGMIGALLHLWAPHAIEGRMPMRRWRWTGLAVAAGLFLVLFSWSSHLSMPHPAIELR